MMICVPYFLKQNALSDTELYLYSPKYVDVPHKLKTTPKQSKKWWFDWKKRGAPHPAIKMYSIKQIVSMAPPKDATKQSLRQNDLLDEKWDPPPPPPPPQKENKKM